MSDIKDTFLCFKRELRIPRTNDRGGGLEVPVDRRTQENQLDWFVSPGEEGVDVVAAGPSSSQGCHHVTPGSLRT